MVFIPVLWLFSLALSISVSLFLSFALPSLSPSLSLVPWGAQLGEADKHTGAQGLAPTLLQQCHALLFKGPSQKWEGLKTRAENHRQRRQLQERKTEYIEMGVEKERDDYLRLSVIIRREYLLRMCYSLPVQYLLDFFSCIFEYVKCVVDVWAHFCVFVSALSHLKTKPNQSGGLKKNKPLTRGIPCRGSSCEPW